MDLIKLAVTLAVILLMVRWKKPLYLAILLGIAAIAAMYGIPLAQCARIIWEETASWETASLLLVYYLTTFIQRVLESRSQLKQAQVNLDGIFNNRRVSATLAPIFIGLMPSAAAAKICAEIVNDTCDGYLDVDEKAFVTSYFRHIPESILPTYAGIILMAQLSQVPVSQYMVGMFPMVLALYAIGYFLYVRKLPKETGLPDSAHKGRDALALLGNLWSLLLIILFILLFDMPVLWAIAIAAVLSVAYYRIRSGELLRLAGSAVEPRLLFNTYIAMLFKGFIAYSGAIGALPALFAKLPIPMPLSFALLFFIGSVISGSQAIIAIGTTIAFSVIPNAGMPLMVLLQGFAYAGMQIAPVHICLMIITEWFHTDLAALIRKTILPISIFCVILAAYYYLLAALV